MKNFLIINTILFFLFNSLNLEKKIFANSENNKIEIASYNASNIKQTDIAKTIDYKNDKQNGNSMLILTALFVGLSSFGLLKMFNNKAQSLTRWAKSNATKTQFLILGSQLFLSALAFYSGHNLKMLGYEISSNLKYVFTALTLIPFFTIPFLPKRETIILPKTLNLRKLAFATITLAGLMNITTLGNHFVQEHPQSIVTNAVQTIDNTIVGANESNVQFASRETKAKVEKHQSATRKAVEAGAVFLFIIMLGLLLSTLCAGICLIVFALQELLGTSGNLTTFGSGAFGAFLSGLAITGLSVWGIIESIKWLDKKSKK
jgi:hypothetical protein